MADVLINLFSPSAIRQVSDPWTDPSDFGPDTGTFDGLFQSILGQGTSEPPEGLYSADELFSVLVAGSYPGTVEQLLGGSNAGSLLGTGVSLGDGSRDPMIVSSEMAADARAASLILALLSLAVLNQTMAIQNPEKQDIEIAPFVTDKLPEEGGKENEFPLVDPTSVSVTVAKEDAPAMELMAFLVAAALQFHSASEEQPVFPAASGNATLGDPVITIGDEPSSSSEVTENVNITRNNGDVSGGHSVTGGPEMAVAGRKDASSLFPVIDGVADAFVPTPNGESDRELAVPPSGSRLAPRDEWNLSDVSLASSGGADPGTVNEVSFSAADRLQRLFERVVTMLSAQPSSVPGQVMEDGRTVGKSNPELTNSVKRDSALSSAERLGAATAKTDRLVDAAALASKDDPTLIKETDAAGMGSGGRAVDNKGIGIDLSTGLAGEKQSSDSSGNAHGDNDRQPSPDANASFLRPIPSVEQGQRNVASEVQMHGTVLSGFDRFEKIAEQLSGKSGIHDLTVKLEVGNNESVVVGLKDLGQSVSVEVKGSNQALVSFLQAQKESIMRHLEGKELRTTIYVDPNASNTSEKREQRDAKRRSFEGDRKSVRSFGSIVETFA